MSAELTLGAEEELHLIDLESWSLSARAPQVLSRLPGDNYSAEIQRTTVETNTDVVSGLGDLRTELVRLRRGLAEVAAAEGLGIASAGTAPRSVFADFELTATGRYGRMQEQYRLLVDEQLICGLQIHVGVSNRDLAVQIMQRVARHLPILLALSASSPFWNGQDTGYSSIRTIIWQRWPSAGATGRIESAQEYDELLDDLINSGVIADRKMAYFDVRPSAHAPTLELRVCDACPIVDDAILIAGLFRGLVRAAEHEIAEAKPFVPFPAPIHRAAIWRAARGGLTGELLDDSRHPRPVPAPQAVRGLLERLRPFLEELNDYDEVEQLVATALARGNSADRQRAAMAERGELDDVVELVVNETQGPPEGLPAEVPELRTYRPRAGDEAVGLGHRPRPVYHDIIDHFRTIGPEGWRQAEERRDAWTDENDVTFGVEQEKRRFSVDLVPRALSPHEWESLRVGLIQRARAIESFLADVYGDQRVLADGVLPTDRVVGCAGLAARGDPAAGRRGPGADHGLRPGPQRVRWLAGAGGQRPQPERGRVRDRDPGPDGLGAAGPPPTRRAAGPGRRPAADPGDDARPRRTRHRSGVVLVGSARLRLVRAPAAGRTWWAAAGHRGRPGGVRRSGPPPGQRQGDRGALPAAGRRAGGRRRHGGSRDRCRGVRGRRGR